MTRDKALRPRPEKIHGYRNVQFEEEFKNIYDQLKKSDLGPFRVIEESGTLYFQHFSVDDKFYKSVASLDSSGNWVTTGTHTASTAIPDVGRS